MNLAIVLKTARDSWLAVALACLGTMGFIVLFVCAMQSMGAEVLDFLARVDFLRRMLEVSLGISVDGEVSSAVLYAVSFTHLVVLAAGWGTIIAIVSRVTAGEEEQGTADLLYSLPLRRSTVFVSTTLVWAAAAALLAACPLAGILVGTLAFPPTDEVHVARYVPVAVNLLALHLAVGGLTALAGVLCNRRSLAIGIVVSVALVSATLNFVEPFLPAISRVNFLGLLHWFRPVDAVRHASWPVVSIIVLAAFGSACWLASLVLHSRKDFPAA
jgi:ABC-type transport system involved in multi-copper enzyme maturation permease subunit